MNQYRSGASVNRWSLDVLGQGTLNQHTDQGLEQEPGATPKCREQETVGQQKQGLGAKVEATTETKGQSSDQEPRANAGMRSQEEVSCQN